MKICLYDGDDDDSMGDHDDHEGGVAVTARTV